MEGGHRAPGMYTMRGGRLLGNTIGGHGLYITEGRHHYGRFHCQQEISVQRRKLLPVLRCVM